ncbi:MAG: TlpA family protein disulfide reductase [Dehalococcoidia bacterium]|nr:TlpA family protein disulfide reductase [Dehalococcoidia bacterium]
MNRHKWSSIPIIALIALLGGSVVACAKQPEAQYAPDFTLQNIDGESVTLSDFRGKPVMLTFWTTRCPACELQAPYIQAFRDEWSSEKVELLTVDVGENPALVHDFVSSQGFTYPVLLDPQGVVAQAYGIPGVPTTFFIDAEGIGRAYKIGPFQSREEIESALDTVWPSLTTAQ